MLLSLSRRKVKGKVFKLPHQQSTNSPTSEEQTLQVCPSIVPGPCLLQPTKFQLAVVNVLNVTKPQLTCVRHNQLLNLPICQSQRSLQVWMAEKQSSRTRSFRLAVQKRLRITMNCKADVPFRVTLHSPVPSPIQIKGPLDPHYFHSSPQPMHLGFLPHHERKEMMGNTVCSGLALACSCVHDSCLKHESALRFQSRELFRNFRPQLCQWVVFVMLSTSQPLLLTKMSKVYQYTSTLHLQQL